MDGVVDFLAVDCMDKSRKVARWKDDRRAATSSWDPSRERHVLEVGSAPDSVDAEDSVYTAGTGT